MPGAATPGEDGMSTKCMPELSREQLIADNIALALKVTHLRKALRVIQKGLTQEADGEFWSARAWLHERDIYHGDLSGERVLDLVATTALKWKP